MMVDVHLSDARTVVRFTGRRSLIALIQRDPATIDEDRALRVWIDRGQGEGFLSAKLQYLRKGSISWVEQIAGESRNAFLAERDPHLLEHILAKEAGTAAADAAAETDTPVAA